MYQETFAWQNGQQAEERGILGTHACEEEHACGEGRAKVFDLGSSKLALLQVDGEAMEAVEVKDVAEV